jgi:flagellar basal-body rod modification protein FlgD
MPTVVANTPPASTQAPGTTSRAKNELDKNAFLQLLVAQLQNQDPTGQGQDPDKMVQQLTSFSSLEQMGQTNTLLQTISNQNVGLAQTQAASLVGRKVKVSGTGFQLKNGQAAMGLDLASSAKVTITIKDASGKVVASIPQAQYKSGSNTITWDGLDSSGAKLPDGSYSVTVDAVDDAGKSVAATPSLFITVDAVTYANGQILLQSGGATYALGDVIQVSA